MAGAYRPANGSEGDVFEERFCARCVKDRAYREDTGDSCEIMLRALVCDFGEAEYPSEWTYDEDGAPTCTAFELDESVG